MAAKQGYGTVAFSNHYSCLLKCCRCVHPLSAGTAVLSKHKPLSVSYTLDHSVNEAAKAPKLEEDDVKGRLVTLEFEKYWVIGTYVPNAGDALKVNLLLLWRFLEIDLDGSRIWIAK